MPWHEHQVLASNDGGQWVDISGLVIIHPEATVETAVATTDTAAATLSRWRLIKLQRITNTYKEKRSRWRVLMEWEHGQRVTPFERRWA